MGQGRRPDLKLGESTRKEQGRWGGGKELRGGGHPNDFDNILQLSSNSSTYGHHTNRRPFQNHATFGILLLISLLGCIKISLMIGLSRVRKDCVEEGGRL